MVDIEQALKDAERGNRFKYDPKSANLWPLYSSNPFRTGTKSEIYEAVLEQPGILFEEVAKPFGIHGRNKTREMINEGVLSLKEIKPVIVQFYVSEGENPQFEINETEKDIRNSRKKIEQLERIKLKIEKQITDHEAKIENWTNELEELWIKKQEYQERRAANKKVRLEIEQDLLQRKALGIQNKINELRKLKGQF